MSHQKDTHGDKTLLMVKFHQDDTKKHQAFSLLCELAFDENRKAKPDEVEMILSELHQVLRYKFNCYYTMWTPADVQDYAEGSEYPVPTLEQAERICHNLDDYEHVHEGVVEAVKNELYTLDKSGAND